MCSALSVIVLVIALPAVLTENFRIGAFNIQIFGKTKAGKVDVMNTLAQIVQRYDILLIEEIRDSKGKAIYDLLKLVNHLGPEKYGVIVSDRLGRTSSKEQYAFMYRSNATIEVLDTYQYPDPEDLFEREPFAAKFSIPQTGVKELILAGVHIDPDVAVEEINALDLVHADLVSHWNSDNLVIMGDFNADCSYVNNKENANLLLRQSKYTWLIDDDQDTTTKSSDCAYDRIIVTGDILLQDVVPNSALVFHYNKAYKLTSEETTAVSDHYPVEFQLHRINKDPASSAPQTLAKLIAYLMALLSAQVDF